MESIFYFTTLTIMNYEYSMYSGMKFKLMAIFIFEKKL